MKNPASRDSGSGNSDSGMTRRALLKTSGALIVSFSFDPVDALGQAVATLVGNPSKDVDGWLAIAADGTVTAFTGKCEMGHGLYTAQTQLVAEELCVPVGRVKLIQCQTGTTPDQGVTSGAQSHPQNFNHSNLALAGATAREALLQMASKHLGAPVDQLTIRDGVVTHQARKVTYGELIGGKKFNLALSSTAKRRHPREWTVLGTSVKRLDMPEMVTGRLEYVQNVRLPGMVHGRVVRPPTVGATLVSVDESSISSLPGFIKVVVKNNFVGVVFEKQWQAIQAAEKLKATWKPGPALPAQASFHDHMRKLPSRDTFVVDSKDVDANLASAAHVVRATYLHPYHMHGSVGSSCAVADVKADGATIWSPTQGVYPQRDSCAMVLGMPKEKVKVIYARGSGCYGINGADTVSYDAALLSQAAGRPVRVQLSRKDEMAWENFGLAFVVDQRAGLDRDGNIIAWDYAAWSPTRGGRPGYTQPGNQVTGFLAGFQPADFAPRPAPPPTGPLANGQNVVPSYVTGSINGISGGTGTIKSERMLSRVVESPFWTGPLRSPNRLQNTFAHECFMDELAARVNADPVEYRLRHLRDPRLMAVVRAAAKAANWQTRPSPNPELGSGTRNLEPGTRNSEPGTRNLEPGTRNLSGRGIACVLYEGDNGYCSMVAEVDVNSDTGVVIVKRLIMALDCGPISNPDGIRNQAEGGALHGVSRALFEEVTWDAEKITSVDWRTYRTFPVGFNVPKLETVLINTMDAEANGAGETSITVTAAAIGNAIFDATGVRVRQVPFIPERIKQQPTNP
jgi:nicotinate dehydrogenase subunit B